MFLAPSFVTVSKAEEVEWETLKPTIFSQIMTFYASGEPTVLPVEEGREVVSNGSNEVKEGDSEVVQMIKMLISQKVRFETHFSSQLVEYLLPGQQSWKMGEISCSMSSMKKLVCILYCD